MVKSNVYLDTSFSVFVSVCSSVLWVQGDLSNLGESAAVIQAVVDGHYLKRPSILTHYAPKDRLNADEFALFFRQIPQKTLMFAGESLHGGKVAKERVSVLVFGSAFGSEFPPIIINS